MTRPIRILELRSVWGTGGGPEKTILLGTARTDPARFDITVCYLRDRRDPIFSVDRKASSLPVNYTELVEAHSFDPTVVSRLRRIVRERRIDILHAHDYKTNVLAWLVARVENVIPLSTVHGWTGHSWKERMVYYPVDKRILGLYPRVITVSSDTRIELIKAGASPNRITVVLNGIDPDAFHRDRSRQPAIRATLGLRDEHVVVGAVGRAEPQKRFDLLLNVFKDLTAHHSNLRLLIAGDGSQLDILRRQSVRLGLGEVCQLLGNRTDIGDLHHAFDLFVQSSDYEGTPNAVLEAMAFETPVVATSAGGTDEIVRDGIDGVVVPPGDQSALFHAINSVIQHPEDARIRAMSARRRIETDLSFATRMAAVESIYVDLFNARRPTRNSSLATAGT
jgi:glycosyltransferase involved in cell wall biosynthesis